MGGLNLRGTYTPVVTPFTADGSAVDCKVRQRPRGLTQQLLVALILDAVHERPNGVLRRLEGRDAGCAELGAGFASRSFSDPAREQGLLRVAQARIRDGARCREAR